MMVHSHNTKRYFGLTSEKSRLVMEEADNFTFSFVTYSNPRIWRRAIHFNPQYASSGKTTKLSWTYCGTRILTPRRAWIIVFWLWRTIRDFLEFSRPLRKWQERFARLVTQIVLRCSRTDRQRSEDKSSYISDTLNTPWVNSKSRRYPGAWSCPIQNWAGQPVDHSHWPSSISVHVSEGLCMYWSR